MINSKVSWDERFEYDVFLARIVEKDLTADDWSLARFDEALTKIRQLIANSNSFQLFSSDPNTNGIPIVRFVLKSKRGRRIRPFNQNYLPLDKSVYEVDVLVRCSDERVEPMFMEYDPSANTLSTYQEASIRIQRKPDCEWGQVRDGWRVFSFVVCKGRQLQLTKAAHTVHRFISLVFPSQQGSRSSSCSPPLPQQQQGSSHCCCPPLPQHNEMEPLLTDTICQLRKEKEDLLREIQELQRYREHRDLLLAENLQLKEEKFQLSWELQQLKESQEHARNSSSSCESPNKRRKIDYSSSSSSSSFHDDLPPHYESIFGEGEFPFYQ